MESYFLVTIGAVFAFLFLFIILAGGAKSAGIIAAVISALALLVFAMSWYSGMKFYSALVSTSTGSARASAKTALIANNFNGEIAMAVCAVFVAIGLIMYFAERIFKKNIEVS
ncbi:MAG: hypothetical protein M1317_07915 [Candidatus Thermoplasmatota archaeon]|nr:hypothetical protein [Candidatus Thermoplasmatota archaeon]